MINSSLKTILLFGHFFYPKVGGVESLMLDQALFFQKRGYQVVVLTSKVGKQLTEETYHGVRIIRKESLHPYNSYPIKKLKTELSNLFQSIKPDLIHCHNASYPFPSSILKVLAIFQTAKNFKIPIIEHAHNAQLRKPAASKRIRELKWDLVICVSQFVKKRWLELGTGALKMEVVYNGINWQRFQSVDPNPSLLKLKKDSFLIFVPARVTLISTGKIDKQKNIILVLQAAKRLLKKGINNFLIVTFRNESLNDEIAAKSWQKFDDLVFEYQLSNNVSFLAPTLPEKMPELFAASDIVCVPSIRETFGLVYLEAMAAGKIAIASNTGGPTEYIKNNQNGFIVDPKNDQQLANILEKVITNKIDQEKIIQNGFKTVKSFSADKTMRNIQIIYLSLLK